MTSTGLNYERDPVTLEKAENVLCMLFLDRDISRADLSSQSSKPTAAIDPPMNSPGPKRKRPKFVASWTGSLCLSRHSFICCVSWTGKTSAFVARIVTNPMSAQTLEMRVSRVWERNSTSIRA